MEASAKPAAQPQAKPKSILPIVIIVVVLAGLGVGVYFGWPYIKDIYLRLTGQATETQKPTDTYKSDGDFSQKFAKYEEVTVNATPAVKSYTITKNLGNVTNSSDFYFSAAQKALIQKNGFVASQGYNKEFFELYESNRYGYTPSFVTTDSMLHNYHLMFNYLLETLEKDKLVPELKSLNAAMLTEALSQYDTLKGTKWENAAKRNVGFFTVGSKLLDSSVKIPSIVKTEVDQEFKFINAHAEIKPSPVMNLGSTSTKPEDLLLEDYSQYIPRGHYDKSAALKAYFKSMMWYGRLTFRLKDEDQIKSSVLITLALSKTANQASWDKIYEPINFFVGKSDDITYYQYADLMKHVFGDTKYADIATVTSDTTKLSEFVTQAKKLEPPQINSMPVFEASIQQDREEEIKGFRFMGQRFTLDASIFQRLVYREVGDKTKTCSQFDSTKTNCQGGARCLPNGLDVPSAMGSDEALNILTTKGETKYACYPENMKKMTDYVSTIDTKTWTQNLYWGWLYSLRPLTTTKSSGYPIFMQNTAWKRKELSTYLGSWAELKHDTILYTKQVYAELGGMEPEKKDDRGYVEPNPDVYARLAALLKMTNTGLSSRDMLSAGMKTNLQRLETLALSLKTISEKELNGEKLSTDDYELIRSYGGQLEHFWTEVNKEEMKKLGLNADTYLDQNPSAIIADVATDPNGKVLEVGTGNVANIYVVFELDGKLRIARGGIYSYYEFSWPLSDRLTDKKWWSILDSSDAPNQPSWTNEFIAK